MKGFVFEEDRIKKEIYRLDAKRVLLQLPEGLKPAAPRLAQTIAKTGATVIISADPCYGACDIAFPDAAVLGIDLIVHFGHARIAKHEKIPTIYVEARSNLSLITAVKKAIPLLKDRRTIGLALAVQHIHSLEQAHVTLVRAGKVVLIGDMGVLAYAGQVTGCDYSNVRSIAKDVEAFLFIGGGRFHAIGVALATGKLTIVADPYENQAYSVNDEAQKILKLRWNCVIEAKDAKTYGILIGLKPGQSHLEEALKIKSKIEEKGLTAYLLTAREITPEALMEFPAIEAYINTACPRISLDAPQKFGKPVLTIKEFGVVSGESSWENLLKEGLFEN